VRRYPEGKFGENLKAVQSAMKKPARAYRPKELAERCFGRDEQFRPEIPEGVRIRRVVREMSQLAQLPQLAPNRRDSEADPWRKSIAQGRPADGAAM
jgi:hypothetical protein